MSQVKEMFTSMDRGDKIMFTQIFVGTASTILVWWYFSGRRKYGTKGMR